MCLFAVQATAQNSCRQGGFLSIGIQKQQNALTAGWYNMNVAWSKYIMSLPSGEHTWSATTNLENLRNKGLLLQKLQTGPFSQPLGGVGFIYQKNISCLLSAWNSTNDSSYVNQGWTDQTNQKVDQSKKFKWSSKLQLGGCQKTLGFTVDQSIIYAFLWRESIGNSIHFHGFHWWTPVFGSRNQLNNKIICSIYRWTDNILVFVSS